MEVNSTKAIGIIFFSAIYYPLRFVFKVAAVFLLYYVLVKFFKFIWFL